VQGLKRIRQNINQINYEVSMDTDKQYLRALGELGIATRIFCRHEDIINDVRLKLFDWNIDLIKRKTKKDLDNADKICDNTYYKNSRIILSGGQKYYSKAAWQRGLQGTEDAKVIDCPEFWEELDSVKLYNRKQNGQTEGQQKQIEAANSGR
jgi:hypothetical protein